MKCRNCPEGKQVTKHSVNCILYGMICRADHECIREGGRRHDREQTGEEKETADCREQSAWASDESEVSIYAEKV